MNVHLYTVVTLPQGKCPQNLLDRKLVAGTQWVWLWYLTVLRQFIPILLLIIRNIMKCCEEMNSNLPGSWLSCHLTLPLKVF